MRQQQSQQSRLTLIHFDMCNYARSQFSNRSIRFGVEKSYPNSTETNKKNCEYGNGLQVGYQVRSFFSLRNAIATTIVKVSSSTTIWNFKANGFCCLEQKVDAFIHCSQSRGMDPPHNGWSRWDTYAQDHDTMNAINEWIEPAWMVTAKMKIIKKMCLAVMVCYLANSKRKRNDRVDRRLQATIGCINVSEVCNGHASNPFIETTIELQPKKNQLSYDTYETRVAMGRHGQAEVRTHTRLKIETQDQMQKFQNWKACVNGECKWPAKTGKGYSRHCFGRIDTYRYMHLHHGNEQLWCCGVAGTGPSKKSSKWQIGTGDAYTNVLVIANQGYDHVAFIEGLSLELPVHSQPWACNRHREPFPISNHSNPWTWWCTQCGRSIKPVLFARLQTSVKNRYWKKMNAGQKNERTHDETAWMFAKLR